MRDKNCTEKEDYIFEYQFLKQKTRKINFSKHQDIIIIFDNPLLGTEEQSTMDDIESESE